MGKIIFIRAVKINTLLLLMCWPMSLVAQTSQIEKPQSGKAVVFDAGSSGTRVFIYDWEKGTVKAELPKIALPQGRTKKVSPGIATFSKNVDGISDYLTPLIDFAKLAVGSDDISKTSLFFAGTAGLRLEQLRNPEGYQKVMNKTKELLQKSGFKITREPGVITGQEEGVFAWVNVNALENRLPKIIEKQDFGIGIVEMGGASFQVAFLPKLPPQQEGYPINLAGKPFVLYAYSYGDLGENEGRAKFSNKEYCEWGDFQNQKSVSDFDKCLKVIVNRIIEKYGMECEECGIGKIFQPRLREISETFYALGALGYLTPSFGITSVNARILEATGKRICNKTFAEAMKEMTALKDNVDLMKRQCFNLAYYSAVLSGNEKHGEDGIGFPGNTTQLIAKNSINGQETTWTYGLLLLHLSNSLK